jgi:serine protease inhibitor ecotin
MRKLILAAVGLAATVTGVTATAADAQPYWGGGGYGRAEAMCQRQASRAWNRREADRVYRHCLKDVRRAERDRMRYERRYRGW